MDEILQREKFPVDVATLFMRFPVDVATLFVRFPVDASCLALCAGIDPFHSSS